MSNHTRLLAIKLIHTIIWVFFVAVIFYILYCGIVNDIQIYTWIGIGLVFSEGLILLLFRMSCPLTVLARRYSDSDRANFDIFLPNWLAKYNKEIFTTLFLIGVGLVVWRVW